MFRENVQVGNGVRSRTIGMGPFLAFVVDFPRHPERQANYVFAIGAFGIHYGAAGGVEAGLDEAPGGWRKVWTLSRGRALAVSAVTEP